MRPTASSSKNGEPSGYRPDIDGLRAIAVLLVVGFHYFERQVGGGLVGVDVFFVISGFLISGLILDGLSRGTFRTRSFYAARVRRIFPALLVVLLAVLTAGWLVLLPSEFAAVGRHVMAGAGFLANIAVWREASYFDVAASTKPLLHLWSLGVEEQFYLVWPVLLIGLWWLTRRVWAVLAALMAASLLWSTWLSYHDLNAAFYSPLSRMWELAVGGVLAAWMRAQPGRHVPGASALSAAGVLAILASALWLSGGSRFPGANAIWPVVGAAMVIAAGPASWINRRLLGHRALVSIGLISYPLYLWHWPLLAFTRVVLAEDLTATVRLSLVALSVVLAAATFLLIERPVRRRPVTPRMVTVLCALLLVVGFGGWRVRVSGGVPTRRAGNALVTRLFETAVVSSRALSCQGSVAREQDPAWPCRFGDAAQATDAGSGGTLVIGDSHAMALAPVFEQIARGQRARIDFAWAAQCPPLMGLESLGPHPSAVECRPINERIVRYVSDQRIRRVVLVARWTFYTDGGYDGPNRHGLNFVGLTRQDAHTQEASRRAFATALRQTVDAYRAMGVEVILVTDAPLQFVEPHSAFRRTVWESDASAYLRDAAVPRSEHERLQSFANGVLGAMAAPGVTIVNLDDVYCGPVLCPFVEGDTSLYRDRDHLSVTGALRTLGVFRALLSVDVSFTDHAPQPHPLAVPDVHDSLDRVVQEPSRHPF